MNVLSLDRKCHIVACLVDGVSIRATARIADCDKETVMRLGVAVGDACARLHDRLFRNLHVNRMEMDEVWDFIGKKRRNVRENDPADYGDVWTWIALDAVNKAIVSFAVGQRGSEDANAFVADVRKRVVNRPQITSDGHWAYREAMDLAFGDEVDFAQLVKTFGTVEGGDAARRYSPGRIIGASKFTIAGNPDHAYVSTSYVERQNLTLRMSQRRFTRLTNAFSRKLVNHRAAVGLYVAHANLCRVHGTLRVTPAMALKVTDHVWSISELLSAALAPSEPTTPAPIPPTTPTGGGDGLHKNSKWRGVDPDRIPTEGYGIGRRKLPTKLTVIDGGKKEK